MTKNGNGFQHKSQRIAAFKVAYVKCGSIGMALRAIGIKSRRTFYNWLKTDAAFKKHYEDELKPNRIDELVTTAFEIATAGRIKVLKSGGFIVDATKPQTDMIKYLLACLDPDNYSEKNVTELVGKGKGGEVLFKVIREHRRKLNSSEE